MKRPACSWRMLHGAPDDRNPAYRRSRAERSTPHRSPRRRVRESTCAGKRHPRLRYHRRSSLLPALPHSGQADCGHCRCCGRTGDGRAATGRLDGGPVERERAARSGHARREEGPARSSVRQHPFCRLQLSQTRRAVPAGRQGSPAARVGHLGRGSPRGTGRTIHPSRRWRAAGRSIPFELRTLERSRGNTCAGPSRADPLVCAAHEELGRPGAATS